MWSSRSRSAGALGRGVSKAVRALEPGRLGRARRRRPVGAAAGDGDGRQAAGDAGGRLKRAEPSDQAAVTPASSTSAIWIAFSAAPFLRLSLARKRASPFVGRRVSADPADEHLVDPRLRPSGVGTSGRRRTRTLGASLRIACVLRRERLLELDPDRLRVADEHRDADAGGADRELGQLQDLARLGAELRLLVRFVAVPVPVHHRLCSDGLGSRAAPSAGPRRPRRTGRSRRGPRQRHDSWRGLRTQVSGIVQQFGLATMRSRSSASRARSALTSGTTSGIAVDEAGRRTTCRCRSPRRGRDRDELAARARADREEEEVDVAGRERLGRRLLDEDLVVAERQARAGRARRREARTFVAALGEQLERDRADRARAADDTDAGRGHRRSVGEGPAAAADARAVRSYRRRPERARPSVTSSAYSRSPPTGRPLASRVTRTRSRSRSAR